MLYRYPAEFIHFVPLLSPVHLCMTVTAHCHQVREAQGDGRVRNVLRSYVLDMVDRIGGCIDATLQTDFT